VPTLASTEIAPTIFRRGDALLRNEITGKEQSSTGTRADRGSFLETRERERYIYIYIYLYIYIKDSDIYIYIYISSILREM